MIEVKNLTKIYKLYKSPKDRLKESLNFFGKKYHEDFYALKNLSFEVKKGEMVGIIGQNGSGKSTLLKILTGVLTQTAGDYRVNGKISSLLELGAGFNPELSGLENVYFNGSILGYSKADMEKKLPEILDFADIGEFIYQPVKTYSSGMYVRLAFSVAINVEPEVLIVDEALSVGDMKFQLKCFRKLEAIKNSGTTILLVTHDTGTVQNQCDRAIWIDKGVLKEMGKPESVCKHYMSFMAYGEETKTIADSTEKISSNTSLSEGKSQNILKERLIPWQSVKGCESFGEGGAQITEVAFYEKKSGKKVVSLEGGEEVCFGIRGFCERELISPIFGFFITDDYGNKIFGAHNVLIGEKIKNLKKGVFSIEYKFTFPYLGNGSYGVTCSVAEGTQINHIQNHWVNESIIFDIFSQNAAAQIGLTLVLNNVNFSLK